MVSSNTLGACRAAFYYGISDTSLIPYHTPTAQGASCVMSSMLHAAIATFCSICFPLYYSQVNQVPTGFRLPGGTLVRMKWDLTTCGLQTSTHHVPSVCLPNATPINNLPPNVKLSERLPMFVAPGLLALTAARSVRQCFSSCMVAEKQGKT